MDAYDRDRYVMSYRLLAEIFERQRPSDRTEDHLSYILGDLARRVLVGSEYDPPDDVLEMTAQVIRSGTAQEREKMASRLRDHAHHLDKLQLDDEASEQARRHD